jgi:hypothetical protein
MEQSLVDAIENFNSKEDFSFCLREFEDAVKAAFPKKRDDKVDDMFLYFID